MDAISQIHAEKKCFHDFTQQKNVLQAITQPYGRASYNYMICNEAPYLGGLNEHFLGLLH